MSRPFSQAASLAIIGMVLSACAGADVEVASDDKLRQATLQAIDGIDPALITISDITRTPAKISWRVTSGARTFACDADGFYRLPWCRPEV